MHPQPPPNVPRGLPWVVVCRRQFLKENERDWARACAALGGDGGANAEGGDAAEARGGAAAASVPFLWAPLLRWLDEQDRARQHPPSPDGERGSPPAATAVGRIDGGGDGSSDGGGGGGGDVAWEHLRAVYTSAVFIR